MRAEELISAVFRRDSRAVSRLLSLHRDLAAQSAPGGLTALHAAALIGNAAAVPVLVRAGAAVDARLTDVQAAWHAIASNVLWPSSTLWVLSHVGHGCTPLHLAAWQGKPDTVVALRAAGADVDAEGLDGRTPLGIIIMAQHTTHRNMMALLLDEGASILRPLHRFDEVQASIMREAIAGWLCGMLVDCLHRRQQQCQREQAEQAGQGQSQGEEAAGPRRSRRLQPPPPRIPSEARQPLTGRQLADVLLAAARGSTPALFEHYLSAARVGGHWEEVKASAASLLRRANSSREAGMLAAVLRSGVCSDLSPRHLSNALCTACKSGQQAAAAALLAHGAEVDWEVVLQVVDTACNAVALAVRLRRAPFDSLAQGHELLQMLLRHGRPAVPLGTLEAPASVYTCPWYRLAETAGVLERGLLDASGFDQATISRGLLRLAEALAEAGYLPTCFSVCNGDAAYTVTRNYCPFDEMVGPPSGEYRRGLEMVGRQEQWSPKQHSHYPAAFRAATRMLLLAHRRGSLLYGGQARRHTQRGALEVQSNLLQLLPPEVLQRVLAMAACPVSAWL